jgi:DNA polymerase
MIGVNKKLELSKIAEEIERCDECKKNKFGLPVPGEGNLNAKIMFIGESPGPTESKIGKPFVGKAGKFLNILLSSINIKREDVFITSPVKYYQGRRSLKKEEILHGKVHLIKQIETINPKMIVTLGKVGLFALFERKFKLNRLHGKILRWRSKIVFPTFHPAAAMRFPKVRKLTEKDFKKLKKIMERL